jgi:hypothetical protein
LRDVGAVIVVEEVVLAHGAHVGVDAFADLAAELLQRPALPLRRRLDHLRLDRPLETEPGGELDRRARAVAVEHVVHAAVAVDDQGDLHELQIQLLGEILLDVALDRVERPHRLHGVENRGVVGGEDLLHFLIRADSRAREVCLLVGRHLQVPLLGSW